MNTRSSTGCLFFVHTVAFLRRLRIVLSHHSVATQSDTSEKTLKALVLIKENQETNKKLKSNNLCTLIDQKGIFHHLSLLPPLNVAAETGWRLCTVQIQACWVSFDPPPPNPHFNSGSACWVSTLSFKGVYLGGDKDHQSGSA